MFISISEHTIINTDHITSIRLMEQGVVSHNPEPHLRIFMTNTREDGFTVIEKKYIDNVISAITGKDKNAEFGGGWYS